MKDLVIQLLYAVHSGGYRVLLDLLLHLVEVSYHGRIEFDRGIGLHVRADQCVEARTNGEIRPSSLAGAHRRVRWQPPVPI